jgi:excisionase family DNA binding protein
MNLNERMRATREHYSIDIRMLNRSTGAPVWVSLDMELDRHEPSGREIWYGLLVDITARKRLEEHLHTHIQALGRLASRLITVMNLDSMIFEMLRELPTAIPIQMARLRVAGVGGRVLTTYSVRWDRGRIPEPSDMTVSRGDLPQNSFAQHVLRTEVGLRVANLPGDRRLSGEHDLVRDGLRSAMAVPVRDQVRIVGVLEAFSVEEEAFLVADRTLLEATASVAALALARQGERWLTVPEVAAMLDVQPETVRRWIRQGDLVAAMPGGVRAGYRVDATQLDAFIKRRH